MDTWARGTTALLVVAVLATALAGCSGRRGRGERPAISRDAGGLPGTDGGPTAMDAGDGGGSTEEEILGCYPGCETVSDCVRDSAVSDADNYECVEGACRFTGCNSDAECAEGLAGDYVCRPTAEGHDGCYPGCETVSDCVRDSAISDADNYECVEGACRFTGCNSDAECAEGLAGAYVCRAI